MSITITQAGLSDVDAVAPLFDAYRQFYEQPADLETARSYLKARLSAGESTVFLACDEAGRAIGFTQLYPTFCSVSAAPIWVLYDLFVAADARRTGAGRKLMTTAQDFCANTDAAWMKLETDHSNIPGQSLYESLGWERDTDYRTYTYSLDAA